MKSFCCQPDSHNAFGSLSNGVLTYFSVEVTRRRRVTAARDFRVPDSTRSPAFWGAGSPPHGTNASMPPCSHPSAAALSMEDAASCQIAPGTGATVHRPQMDVEFTTESRVRVQCALTLPDPFHNTQCCFSMANHSVFLTDMVFIGAANGLLALAVLSHDLLLYVRGKDPQGIQDELQRRQTAGPSAGQPRSASFASTAASERVSPRPSFPLATTPGVSAAGGVGVSSSSSTVLDGGAGRAIPSASSLLVTDIHSDIGVATIPVQHSGSGVNERYAEEAPSTITWLRDRPLIFVGYTSGRVEWYMVQFSAARRQSLADATKEGSPVISTGSNSVERGAVHRREHARHVKHVAVGGQWDGIDVEMMACSVVRGAGALVSSDFFASNGTVAVVGERGVVCLFHADHVEAPLCTVQLETPGPVFLYCHPFLPLIGVLSRIWGRTIESEAAVATAATRRPYNSPNSLLVGKGEASGAPNHDDHGDPAGPPPLTAFPSAAATTPQVLGKQSRHVGWHDAGASASNESARGRPEGAAGGRSGTRGNATARSDGDTIAWRTSATAAVDEVLRTGCVLSLVEYRQEAALQPTTRRGGTGTKTAPSSSSGPHRLTPVLQYRMNGAAPLQADPCTFSWKFSAELELAVSNLEARALRIVRVARTAASPRRGERSDGKWGVSSGEAAAMEVIGGARDCASTSSAAAALCVDLYSVSQDYAVQLPLHHLANVEYISAATAALNDLEVTASTGAHPREQQWSSSDAGLDSDTVLRKPKVHVRVMKSHAATVRALAASTAVEPYPHIGFRLLPPAHSSTVGGGGGSGVFCRPTNPLWHGLALVSKSQRTRRRHRSHGRDTLNHADTLDELCKGEMAFGPPYRTLHAISAAASTGIGGPSLKENALAAQILEPLREGGRVDGGASATATFDHPFTLGLSQAAAFLSTSPAPRRWHRQPLSPAITLPSYVRANAQKYLSDAALIAAHWRADLRPMLRIGQGYVSYVVGMDGTGRLASVPVEGRALTAWHEAGSIFVGLGSTLCAADLVSMQETGRLMRQRHAAGFGLSSHANVVAARGAGGYGSEDVALLFSYVATLEELQLVSAWGPVPSIMELLSGAASSCCSGNGDGNEAESLLGSYLRIATEDHTFRGNPHLLLVLRVLGWRPTLGMDGAAPEQRLPPDSGEHHTASVFASSAPSQPLACELANGRAEEGYSNTEIERAVAVMVTLQHYAKASELLHRFSSRSPSYRILAVLLENPEEVKVMMHVSGAPVLDAFCASLTPWLRVIFHYLCSFSAAASQHGSSGTTWGIAAKERDSAAKVPPTVLPSFLYQHPQLPFWDRVALAYVVETDRRALHHVLHEILWPQCNPVQALLLCHGVHLRTCSAMQEIVDCTGDFQLGACLFARVGVLTSAAALAFPFLLDAEVSAAVAAAVGTDAQRTYVYPVNDDVSPHVVVDDSLAAFSASPPLLCRSSQGGAPGKVRKDSMASVKAEATATITTNVTADAEPDAFLSVSSTSVKFMNDAAALCRAPAIEGGAFLDDSAAHAARLVRESILPPPPLHPTSAEIRRVCSGESLTPGSVVAGTPGNSPSSFDLLHMQALSGVSASRSTVGGDKSVALHDQCDDGDVPWVWWAAAYRSFLDDEKDFVRRATFDVECRKLREKALRKRLSVAVHPYRLSMTEKNVMDRNEGNRVEGGANDLARASPPLPGLPEAGFLPSAEDLVSLAVAQRVAHRVAGAEGRTLGEAGKCRSPAEAPPPRLHAAKSSLSNQQGGPGGCEGNLYTCSPATEVAVKPKLCVCRKPHTATQLIRSLLSRSRSTPARCSVCLEPVQLGAKAAVMAYAWCTSCGHGGHAHHLQDWFDKHQQCPVDGCDCDCSGDATSY